MATKRDDDFNRITESLRLVEDYVIELEGKITGLEEDKKHYARLVGSANSVVKQLKEQITNLESTISGYEAVMKEREKLDDLVR